jgi:spermidine/putrescine transport system substrate-binding protein
MKHMELSEFKDRLAAGTLTRRQIGKVLASVGVASVALPLTRTPAAADTKLEVFTWAGWDAHETAPQFFDNHGAPHFTLFGDDEEAFQKVRAGFRPDLVVPTNFMQQRWDDSGLLDPIDTSRLEAWDDLFPVLKSFTGSVVDGKQMQVPWCWGNSTVVFRKDLAPEYSGAKNNSWSILWDPKYKGRLAQRDAMEPVVIEAALLLGLDPFHLTDDQIEQVRQKLVEQRPLLRFYWSSQADAEQALASGEVVASYAWNDGYAHLVEQGVPVEMMNPKEGIQTWINSYIMIHGGPGSEQDRYDFLNATLAPEVGKWLIEGSGYGSSNKEAFTAADKTKLKTFGYDDPSSLLANSVLQASLDPALHTKLVKMFEEVKAGF